MDMEVQPLQGSVLIGAIAALAVILYLFGGYASLPYLGFAIGVAGISISIQQFYIYSLITNVVDIQRKEFYRATSRTLLFIGGAILLLCSGRIVLEVNPELVDNFHVLTRLGLILLYMSPPLLGGLILYFFYPAWRQGRASQRPMGSFYELYSDIVAAPLVVFSTKLNDDGSPKGLLPSRMLQVLWLCLLITCFAAAAATIGHWVTEPPPTQAGSVAYGLPFDLKVVLIWALGVTLFYGVLCLALMYYVRDCINRATLSPGQSLLSGFLFLFAAPPIFQGMVFAARSVVGDGYWQLVLMFAAVTSIPLIALFSVFRPESALGYLSKILANIIFTPAFRERLNENYSASYSFNIATKGAIVIAIFLVFFIPYLAIQFQYFIRFPWVFTSYGFLALGCAGMTALDLRNASAAFDSIRDTYLTTDMQTGLAHEVINSLRPGRGLLNATALERLLEDKGDSDPLAQDKKRLREMLEPARHGLDSTMEMITSFRDRSALFSKAADTRGDLREFVDKTLAIFRKGRTDMSGEWSVSLVPGERIAAPFNAQALYHTLRILLDNAVDATQERKRNEITVQVINRGQYARIEIQDTGKGMSEEIKQRFGAMQVSAKAKGTGAGTSIAKSFVNRMNGRLSVDFSEPGAGTRVVVELPIRQD